MKYIKYLMVTIILSFLGIANVLANEIKSIDITLNLDSYGNGHIEEVWYATMDSKTELYKPMGMLGNSEITNFKVSMDGVEYTYIDKWDIDASFSEKAYKNGIHKTTSGFELCYGISKYGTHKYVMSYDVSNMIYNLEDAQTLYWKFINDDMSLAPKKFSVRVIGPDKFQDTLDVWGYGYKGYAYVYDGVIEMSSDEDTTFKSSNYAVLLVKFPLNTFNTTNKTSLYNTFDDVYKKADEGSFEYDIETLWDKIKTWISVILVFGGSMFFIYCIYIGSKDGSYLNNKLGDDINPFRDIPCNKNILEAFFLAKIYNMSKKKEDLFGAAILKWVLDGQVVIKEEEQEKIFKNKKVISIDMTKEYNDNGPLGKLYKMLKEASKDGILESHELEKWSSNNYNKLFNWFTEVESYVKNDYVNKKLLTTQTNGRWITYSQYYIEPKLEEEAIHLAGLKKFLKEVSSIHEKRPIEVNLWEYYLMYAQIFGIAKEVANSFKKLYPDIVRDMESEGFNYTTFVMINNLGTTTVHAASQAKQRAESYSSGGGGHSFGGGGGGSFGGGSGGGAR